MTFMSLGYKQCKYISQSQLSSHMSLDLYEPRLASYLNSFFAIGLMIKLKKLFWKEISGATDTRAASRRNSSTSHTYLNKRSAKFLASPQLFFSQEKQMMLVRLHVQLVFILSAFLCMSNLQTHYLFRRSKSIIEKYADLTSRNQGNVP